MGYITCHQVSKLNTHFDASTDYKFCGMESLPSPLNTKKGADISHLAFPQVRIPRCEYY